MPATPDPISFPDPGAEHLRRAIGQLPTHVPDAAGWARIEAQLAADAALPRLVAALPVRKPANDLWADIAGRLDEAPAPAVAPARRTHRVGAAPAWWRVGTARRALALAASLVLLVLAGGGWWQWHHPAAPVAARHAAPAPGPHETLTVTEEVLDRPLAATQPALAPNTFEQQGLAFIRQGCSRQPAVCGSPEFRRLHAQLAELQAQQQELRQATRRFGNSHELARQQARLVNLQATIERQLITLFIS